MWIKVSKRGRRDSKGGSSEVGKNLNDQFCSSQVPFGTRMGDERKIFAVSFHFNHNLPPELSSIHMSGKMPRHLKKQGFDSQKVFSQVSKGWKWYQKAGNGIKRLEMVSKSWKWYQKAGNEFTGQRIFLPPNE